jgi:hypothetical protein
MLVKTSADAIAWVPATSQRVSDFSPLARHMRQAPKTPTPIYHKLPDQELLLHLSEIPGKSGIFFQEN